MPELFGVQLPGLDTPKLHPDEHALIERAAGRELTNEEAQLFIKDFYCCREHAMERINAKNL